MNWPAFENPWMLAGLAAIGLPVLIHFLTRARPRRIAFPPFKFLVEACAGQQAIHRLRTILLLSVRCLAVLALVMLLARPFLKPSGAGAGQAPDRRVAVVLDGSLSMRAVQRGVPLFTRAQAEAAEALKALPSGSEAAVIIAGASPASLLPALSQNIPALHEGLVRAAPTFDHADFPAALALAKRLLGGPGEVYVFSDFQRSNWEQVKELPGGLVFRLRQVTSEPVANLALTALRISPAEPVAGEPAEVACGVFNCTPSARQETVRLELGDMTREARVSVPAFGTAEAVFNLSFPQPGLFSGKAWLGADDLREDNTRYLAVRVRKAMQVLLLSDADAEDARSAAFFVGRALAPSAQAAPGISVARRHSQDADRGILETADAFAVVAPAMPSAEAAEIITRRINEGAQLLLFLDGPTSASLLLPSFNPPFRLLTPVASEAGDGLVFGARKLFADSDAADWAPLRFRRHYQNQVLQGRGNEVMLSYADASAALALTRLGKGAIVFANIPLTPESGDFVGSPMFPALMHELLRAIRRGGDEGAVTPGTAWTLDAPVNGDSPVTVSDPDGQSVETRTLASGRMMRLALPPARLPGFYWIKQATAAVAAGVVNVDPRESDTRPLALESLKAGQGTAVKVLRGEEDVTIAGNARPLWPQLAALAAALLGLEMLLSALWRPAIRQTRI